MQRNEAYGAYAVSTSGNEYDIVQVPQPCINVDSNLPTNNKATSSRQRKISSWGLTTAVALLALIIAVVGVILGATAVRSDQTLQQELISLKEKLASLIQNGEKLVYV